MVGTNGVLFSASTAFCDVPCFAPCNLVLLYQTALYFFNFKLERAFRFSQSLFIRRNLKFYRTSEGPYYRIFWSYPISNYIQVCIWLCCKEMEPLESPWYVFHSLQSLAGGCYQQPFPNSMSATKWTDSWIYLHQNSMEINRSGCFTWWLDGQPLL